MDKVTGTRFITALLIITYIVISGLNAWICDDAFITFRSVDNFLHGRGLVWNVGERVQSFTHPLWMFLLSGTIWVTGEYFYTTLLLSVLVSTLCALVVGLWLAQKPGSAWFALIVLTLSTTFVDYTTSGLENPLSHLLLALFFLVLVRGDCSNRYLFLLALIAGFGALNRPDSLLLYGPSLVFAYLRVRSWSALGVMILGFLPLILWEIFSILYYGFPFPNTAYAKLGSGIPRGELIQQGMLYLLESAAHDPLGAIVILGAIGTGLWLRHGAQPWAAIGVFLYGLYVVDIGGDFMAGRLLSPLVLIAAIMLARTLDHLAYRYRLLTIVFAVVAGLALATPASPLRAIDGQVANSRDVLVSESGISNERVIYLAENGLVTANRTNRLTQQGLRRGLEDPEALIDCGGIGIRAFRASPYTYVIDTCGLSDPLLARLPAAHDRHWRIGHFRRILPDGYEETIRSGQNHLTDANLASYYDKLTLLTRGRIFDPARLRAIWPINTGQYDHLIDERRYRYPGATTVSYAAVPHHAPGETDYLLTASGLYIDFDDLEHAAYLKLGLDCTSFDLAYYSGGDLVILQKEDVVPIRMGKERLTWTPIPSKTRHTGFDRLHVIPKECNDSTLRSVSLVGSGHNGIEFGPQTTLLQAVELYYFLYYRDESRQRNFRLAQLHDRIAAAESAEWQTVPFPKLLNLLKEPTFWKLVEAPLPSMIQIFNADGRPILHHLGVITDEDDDDVKIAIYFAVLEPVGEDFLIQLELTSVQTPAETAVYHLWPEPPMGAWLKGTIQKASTDLELAAGTYQLAYCFVAPESQQALTFQSTGTSCTSLSEFQIATAE